MWSDNIEDDFKKYFRKHKEYRQISKLGHDVLKVWVPKFGPIQDSGDVSTHPSLWANPNQNPGASPETWINREILG